MNGINAHILDL